MTSKKRVDDSGEGIKACEITCLSCYKLKKHTKDEEAKCFDCAEMDEERAVRAISGDEGELILNKGNL